MHRQGVACLWKPGGAGRRLTLVALCAALLLALGAGTAAAAAYTELGSFAGSGSGPGGSGSEDGQLYGPGQADVNDANGNLYVADTLNNRVQVFKPNATGGEYEAQVAIAEPVGIAIDQASGDVYVANASGVSKFTSALAPIGAPDWTAPSVTGPLAVDPAAGDLLVADTAGNLIHRFNSDGSADGSFAAARPIDLAADSGGDVLVITSTGDILVDCQATSTVRRFSSGGVEEGTVGDQLSRPGAIAVDPDDDSIVIGARVNQYNCGQGTPQLAFFTAAGLAIESHDLAPDTQYAMVPGLAVAGGGSNRLYAVTRSPANDGFGATKVTAASFEVPPPSAPEIVSQAVLRGADSATLKAVVYPGGDATTYHFEYGTTAAYGQQTGEASIPAGFENIRVSAPISGLVPGTTYHFRVVAENSLGAASGPDRVFTTLPQQACPNEVFRTGASANLRDCRAYELVTPIGSEADIRVIGGPLTPDGNAVCFQTEDQLLDAVPNGIKSVDDGFCSWRTAAGWETKWVTGPAAPNPSAMAFGGFVHNISPDGRRVVFSSDGNLLGPDYAPKQGEQASGIMSAYMWEGGRTSWLAPAAPPEGNPPVYPPEDARFNKRRPVAVSADLTHGLFESERRTLPQDENEVTDLYEWFPGGLRLVSSDASGKAAGGRVLRPGQFQMAGPPGAMSADGSRVFFEHAGTPLDGDVSEAPEGQDPFEFGNIHSVYLREGDEVTLISPRGGTGPDTSVWFVGAPSDGAVAYLETLQQLTPEPKQPGTAIYRYDVAGGDLELVADGPAGVRFLTLSKDGSTFVYRDLGSNELIVDRDGTATTLGKFANSDVESEQGAAYERTESRMLRVSPDGRVVVFAAAGEFAGFGPGPIQVYRWQAGAGVERISAVEGSEPESNASIGAYPALIGSEREEIFAMQNYRGQTGQVMSEDGSRVFFETREPLVSRDSNGFTDVYEWHNGEISLVSDGTGGNSFYHGNSADGSTVFITTFDRLLPESDRNAKRDLYAVRSGGGFPPPSPPPACEGEACQPGRAAPAPNSARTDAAEGAGARGFAAVGLRKGGRTVRVGVLVPGRVTVKLAGKLGKKGKAVTVAKASKIASQAGTLVFRLQPSRRARQLLAQRGRLRLTLTVTHVDLDQTITRKVTLHD